jgi:hypothetical protein
MRPDLRFPSFRAPVRVWPLAILRRLPPAYESLILFLFPEVMRYLSDANEAHRRRWNGGVSGCCRRHREIVSVYNMLERQIVASRCGGK